MRLTFRVSVLATLLICGCGGDTDAGGITCVFPEVASGDECTCAVGYTPSNAGCVPIERVTCCECLAQEEEVGGSSSCLVPTPASCIADTTLSASCYCWNRCQSACGDVLRPATCTQCTAGSYWDENAADCLASPTCPPNSHATGPTCSCDEGYAPDGSFCVMLNWHCGDGVCFTPCGAGETGACSGGSAVCCEAAFPYACVADTLCYGAQSDCADTMPVAPIPCP